MCVCIKLENHWKYFHIFYNFDHFSLGQGWVQRELVEEGLTALEPTHNIATLSFIAFVSPSWSLICRNTIDNILTLSLVGVFHGYKQQMYSAQNVVIYCEI